MRYPTPRALLLGAMLLASTVAHAQYAWLSAYSHRRIAWSPALRAYFDSHFVPVMTDLRGDVLYRRQRSGG